MTKPRSAPFFFPERWRRFLPVCAVFLVLLRAASAESVWQISGNGNYLESRSEATNLVNKAIFRFEAEISDAPGYRIEVTYENLRDVMVYDGTNTVVYRMIDQPGGTAGSDVIILPGSYPEHLPGYLPAVWMSTYLNLAMSKGFDTNALVSITKSTYLLMNFGEELAKQAVVRRIRADTGVRYGVFIPGNATKDGHQVFQSDPYTNGVMFQSLEYLAPHPSDKIYRNVEVADCVLYRTPRNPEDVRDLDRHSVRITSVKEADAASLELPKISGNVWVSDFSLDAGSKDKPLHYSLTSWGELSSARERALGHSRLSSYTSDSSRRKWVIVVLFAVVSGFFLAFLLNLFRGSRNNNQQTKSNT